MPKFNPTDPTPWYDRRLWQITPVRDAFWIALIITVIVLALWFGYALRAVFTPVLIALALAYLFDPIITQCERRWHWPRPATISGILAVLGLVAIICILWLGPKLVTQVKDLALAAPQYVNQLAARAGIEPDEKTRELVEQISKDPMAFLAGRVSQILVGTGQAIGFVTHIIGQTSLVLLTLALIPIYFFFFAWHFGPLARGVRQYIPLSHRPRTFHIIGRMDRIVATYFRARVVIALIMGVMFSVGWAMAGVPYWLLLGMGSGVLSIVPFASGLGWPLAVGLKWLSVTSGADAPGFEVWSVLVWPSAVYLVVQAFEGWVLTPWIQGKSMDMSTVTVLIVMFIGGAVGGLYGLLLCIPLVACIKILCAELLLPRIRQWSAEN